MNSYPHEFLAHPQPLMFVAGLTPSIAEAGPSNRRDSVSISLLDSGATRSRSNSTALAPASLTTPVVSPTPTTTALPPTSPPPGSSLSVSENTNAFGGKGIVMSERDSEFDTLVKDLRGAIGSMSGRGKVWLPERQRRDFRMLLVDKGVRLPMRKVPPQQSTDPYAPAPTTHSPLSPLTPTSPLYPDGLIAPVWVRKHAELVPSVFVLFLRLYEPTMEGEDTTEHDDLLVKEIAERRRKLGERGIKLTVVLMASATTLDPRLSYLRRASALSSKASLFVLTPVPASQLPDFVQSLQDALYDSAMEYYSAHAKRVRRKRARLPVNLVGSSSLSVSGIRALGNQGWSVRYDWKMGWFAEIKGEYEVARRHYEDCWNELAKMFTSTTMLPPRTKRWAEAKVLADCVAMNICRLLLYEGDGTKVLGPFFVHLKKFSDLSRGWGIGEETFEFWSWIARQYRIFAELIELGIQSGLGIPSAPLPLYPTAQTASIPPPPPEYFVTPTSSSSPIHVLHQPGFYYYTAACCSIERKKRFERALEAEKDAMGSEAGSASGYVSTAPGFANEKKVDHAALIVELFTKAYSLFKEQEFAQTRIALYVAFRIAETYTQSGQHEMAMRFFDRISQTFKRDRWEPIVRQIRTLWYECAQHTGDVETAARILVEMMGHDSGIDREEKAGLQDDLISLLKTTSPSTTDPLVINMDTDSSLLEVKAGFWQSSAIISTEVSFQLVLSVPTDVVVSKLDFAELHISFSDDRADLVIRSQDTPVEGRSHVIDLGQIGLEGEHSGTLKWDQGGIVILGKVVGEMEGDLQMTGVALVMKQGSWDIQLQFIPKPIEEWLIGSSSMTPLHGLSSRVQFVPRPHLLIVDVEHRDVGYVNESVPIVVRIKNNDAREFNLELSVFLQPGEDDDTSTIMIDSEESRTLITNFSLGPIPPSASIVKTIHLRSPFPLEKTVDISIISSISTDLLKSFSTTSSSATTAVAVGTVVDGQNVNPAERAVMRSTEINRTISVQFEDPFLISNSQVCRLKPRSSGLDERDIAEGVISTLLRVEGSDTIHLKSIELESGGDEGYRLISSSLNRSKTTFPQDWEPGTSYTIYTKFALSSFKRTPNTSSPGRIKIQWRSPLSSVPDQDSDPNSHPKSLTTTTTILTLPHLSLPLPTDSFLIARLHHPPTLKLNEPFTLSLEIINTHPTSPCETLSLQIDTNESFVWTASRVTRLPIVPAGERIEIGVQGIAVGEVGWIKILGIRIWDRVVVDHEFGVGLEVEQESRREIRVVDANGDGMILVKP